MARQILNTLYVMTPNSYFHLEAVGPDDAIVRAFTRGYRERG